MNNPGSSVCFDNLTVLYVFQNSRYGRSKPTSSLKCQAFRHLLQVLTNCCIKPFLIFHVIELSANNNHKGNGVLRLSIHFALHFKSKICVMSSFIPRRWYDVNYTPSHLSSWKMLQMISLSVVLVISFTRLQRINITIIRNQMFLWVHSYNLSSKRAV